jgi:hypothetical protein
LVPPTTRTMPFDSRVAVWPNRGVDILLVGDQVAAAGSYNSALAIGAPFKALAPPAARTNPLGSNVAVCDSRAATRFPVGNHEVVTIESAAVEVTVPIVAEIVVDPSATPVATPVVGPTVAIGELDVQVAIFVTFVVVESEYVAVAVNG